MSKISLWVLPALVLAALTGCGVTENNFLDKSAKTYCKYIEKCYLGNFVDQWDDMKECVDDYIDDNEDYFDDLSDDCDFEPDKANDCLDSFKTATRTCDEDDIEYDDCYEVWDC